MRRIVLALLVSVFAVGALPMGRGDTIVAPIANGPFSTMRLK